MPAPKIETRADVDALKLPLATKTVLDWLARQPAKVYERAEIAKALNAKPSEVETQLTWLQRRPPFLLARVGPAGEPLRERHGYLAPDSPVRAAYAVRTSTTKKAKE